MNLPILGATFKNATSADGAIDMACLWKSPAALARASG